MNKPEIEACADHVLLMRTLPQGPVSLWQLCPECTAARHLRLSCQAYVCAPILKECACTARESTSMPVTCVSTCFSLHAYDNAECPYSKISLWNRDVNAYKWKLSDAFPCMRWPCAVLAYSFLDLKGNALTTLLPDIFGPLVNLMYVPGPCPRAALKICAHVHECCFKWNPRLSSYCTFELCIHVF